MSECIGLYLKNFSRRGEEETKRKGNKKTKEGGAEPEGRLLSSRFICGTHCGGAPSLVMNVIPEIC